MSNLNDMLELSRLVVLDPQPVWGEKCGHDAGNMQPKGLWAVKLEDKFYVFEPPTQMQKDIWLGEANGDAYFKGLKMGALRWYCKQCGSVQEP